METNLNQLRCGQCGETKLSLYLRTNSEVLAECIRCNSVGAIFCLKREIEIKKLSVFGTFGNFNKTH
jgi:hypothetical protein